jgi:hypothetical protein
VDAAETALLAAYAPVFDPADTCSALNGVTVSTLAGTDNTGFDTPRGRAMGEWDFNERAIRMVDIRISSSNTFAHETGHAFDYILARAWARDPSYCPPETASCGDMHFQWTERGFMAAQAAFKAAMNP